MSGFVVRPGNLIDGVADVPKRGMEVVIADGEIADIRLSGSVPVDGVRVIDIPNGTLIPGLIDLHMHVFQWKQPHDRPGADEPILEVVLRGIENASELLDLGVTTARDVASRDNLSIHLRDLIGSGRIRGPRFLASGTHIEAAGRADYFFPAIHVTGEAEAQRAARQQLRAGADWIKIMSTSGVGGGSGGLIGQPGWQELTESELRAATVETHMANRRITTHAIGNAGIKAALRAGVDCIEHGSFLDDEAIEMMLERDVSLVPTLRITRNLGDFGIQRGFEINIVERAKQVLDSALQSVGDAFEAGVRVGVGSDVDLDETAAQEIRMLIEAGLTPMQAIQAGTVRSAEVIGMQDRIGTVEIGKVADLVVVQGNPVDDPTVLDDVSHIFQGGNLVKEPV